MPTIAEVESQLHQRITQYPPTAWGRKQTDAWDRQTNFIYHTSLWSDLVKEIGKLEKPVADYAVNRWFNFWSAVAVEKIFCAMPGVTPNKNQYDRLVDFSIQGIKFDHKTSVFPGKYSRSVDFAQHNKPDLIMWLYENQSQQQRYHLANRLFIILYARDSQHWKLRAEISELSQLIKGYVANFDATSLVQVNIGNTKIVSDIIWFMK